MKKPCVILINPKLEKAKAFWPPLGLAYMAAYLEKDSFKVNIIDANVLQIEDEDIVDSIKVRPDIVGITTLTANIYSVWKIAKLIKQKFPGVLMVLGGHHVSVLPEESLSNEFIDIVVRGEGEKTLRDIACAVEQEASMNTIKGISYKKEGAVFHTEAGELIQDLDSLPFPAWHLLPALNMYTPEAYKRLPVALLFTSRGCPCQCTFCYSGIFGNTFRSRSAQHIISEILFLKENFGIKEFHICDDNFILNKKRAKRFCDLLIEKKINLPWAAAGGMRVDAVVKSPDLIYAMAKTGCYRTAVGIESGNQEILNNIKKNITLPQIRDALKILNKAKMLVGGFFMIGNYGETEDTINDTILFAKTLSLDYAQFMIATPYPGTVFYDQVLKEGKILIDNWKDFNIWKGAAFEWKNLTKEKIDQLYRKAYIRYYFTPSFFLKSILNLKIGCWRIYLRGFLIIIKDLLWYKTPMS